MHHYLAGLANSLFFLISSGVRVVELVSAVLVPADPSMQFHKMFAEIMDPPIRDVWQVKNFAQQYVVCKTDDLNKTFSGIHIKPGNHSTQTIDKFAALANQ